MRLSLSQSHLFEMIFTCTVTLSQGWHMQLELRGIEAVELLQFTVISNCDSDGWNLTLSYQCSERIWWVADLFARLSPSDKLPHYMPVPGWRRERGYNFNNRLWLIQRGVTKGLDAVIPVQDVPKHALYSSRTDRPPSKSPCAAPRTTAENRAVEDLYIRTQ